MNILFYIIYLFSSVYLQPCTGAPQCMDQNGNPVDWYVLYKLPKLKNNPDLKIARGVAYAFITSETVKQGWQLSDVTIMDPKSIPGRTLSFMFPSDDNNEVNDYFWILYNDQPPNETYTEKDGHTKGIVAGNYEGGFWIVHSVPKFPVTNQTTYKYPLTGTIYGQSFLCISMNQSTLNTVGDQLITNCAHVFNSSFSSELESTYPSLVKAAKKERGTQKKRKEMLYSVGNNLFVSFAKSEKFGADLYSDWVSEILHSELYVETWLHDDKLPSACNETYQVCNVKLVSMSSFSCEFENYHDHSKYAISAKSKGSWVCIGDINRASTQFKRGGGTVCIENESLWPAYIGLISEVESCPNNYNLRESNH